MREQMQGDLFSEADAKRQVKELRTCAYRNSATSHVRRATSPGKILPPPAQAKKQTDGPQTRANTRLQALNAQEGSREQREKGRKVRLERRLPEGHAQEDTAGNRANTGGTGKKNPNR